MKLMTNIENKWRKHNYRGLIGSVSSVVICEAEPSSYRVVDEQQRVVFTPRMLDFCEKKMFLFFIFYFKQILFWINNSIFYK